MLLIFLIYTLVLVLPTRHLCLSCPTGTPFHGVSQWEPATTMEHRAIRFSNCWAPHWFFTRIQRAVCSCRNSNRGNLTFDFLLFLLCGNRFYFFDVMSFSVHFLAVQANYCPGPGGRLCRCSAGGPCPTVPAGQRNSQAAFVNSVPIVTLAKQTVKGEKLWGRMKLHKLLGHKQTETLVLFSTVVYSSLWPGQLLLNQFCSDVLMICFNYFFLFSSWCFPATFSFL